MNFLTGIGGSFVTSLFGWLTGDLAGLLTLVGDVISHAGSTATIDHAVNLHYSRMLGIAPLVAVMCVPVAVLVELRRGAMWRPFLYLAIGMIVAGVAPKLGTLILRATDALGQLMTSDVVGQIEAVGNRLNIGALSPAGAVVGIICVSAGVIVCFELVIRSVMAVLLICVVPLIAGGLSWSPARRAMIRLVETFAAIALSKLVIELALALGLTLLTLQRGVSLALMAGATLCLAACTPFVVLRLVPIGEMGSLLHLDGLRQRLVTNIARSPQHLVAQAARSIVPVQPPALPTMPEDLGLEMWPGEPERPLPDRDGPPPRPPVQPVRFPRRPVIRESESGPRIEWEWDDE